ncbi:MAG TPA: phosphate acyltransferase PlsX [Candidatus Nitrosotenuis sp.]|jgi:glycerol-3-phosphate acyltransferase PlsX|nr:phosphate acyltransferase PlsX [Candidatus Nitrosotenuis sp.]
MKIVIDAMGGDHAPAEIVRGVARASREVQADLCLVGDERKIRAILLEEGTGKPIEVVHTDDFITMDESPGPALRRRERASMVMAARMVREGQAQALVSAGNTAALHQVALTVVGRIHGIKRPALTVILPSRPPTVALDMGANADVKPEYLVQFAIMGSIYAEKILGRTNPRVGLLNIGSEVGKGNSLVTAAYPLLEASGVNFVGNVEPYGVFRGQVDVAVCDGFTGNMFLKSAEAAAEFVMDAIKEAARATPASRLGGLLMKPALKRLLHVSDQAEHGGAGFLGLRGVVIKCHGRANARAIQNGVKVAARVLDARVIEKIAESLSEAQVVA